MKKKLLLTLIVFVSATAYSQFSYELPEETTYSEDLSSNNVPKKDLSEKKDSKSGFDTGKLTFESDLGFSFIGKTKITIAPQVGYKFTKKISSGFGVSYTHYSDKYNKDGESWRERSNYVGTHVYARYHPNYFMLFQIRPEIGRTWISDIPSNTSLETIKTEKFVPAILVSAGLRLGPVVGMINYDLLQHNNSPYSSNVFFSLGFMFNL